MACSTLLTMLGVVVAVTTVAKADVQCNWYEQPVPRDNDLVTQTVNLAVIQLQDQGTFTGTVEAFDEAALYEYDSDFNITLSEVEAMQENTPKGVVQCDLTGMNANIVPKIVTSACVGPNTRNNWQLHIKTEFAILVEDCKIMGMATADVLWPYGPYQPRDQPANLTSVRFHDWAISTTSGFAA